MMVFIFSGITLSAVVMAAFVSNLRHAILALWVAGLGVGSVYLTLGAELLAIVQWILSTLVTIAFIFFAVMFGEYNESQKSIFSGFNKNSFRKNKDTLIWAALSVILGAGFSFVIWHGSKDLTEAPQITGPVPSDLGMMGRVLTQDNLLSLEVLGLTLFLVLVGGGVVARFEREDQS